MGYSQLNISEALALHQSGNIEQALAIYRQLLEHDPNDFSSLSLAGVALCQSNQFDLGIAYLRRALEQDPQNVSVLGNLGNGLMQAGKEPEALLAFSQALSLAPDDPGVMTNYANCLVKQERFDEAFPLLQRSYEKAPNISLTVVCLSSVFRSQKKFVQAQTLLSRHLQEFAQDHQVLNAMGAALQGDYRHEDALTYYQRAIDLAPQTASYLYNYALCSHEMGRLQEALAAYGSALSLEPGNNTIRWNRALCLLANGDYEIGFAEYEQRQYAGVPSMARRRMPVPHWNGQQSIRGKTVYVGVEQGFGDIIMFARYAQHLKRLGAKVILEVPIELLDLAKGFHGVDEVCLLNQFPLGRADFFVSVMSLPFACRTTISNIPAYARYLELNSEKLGVFAQKLGPKVRPRIGIAWRGRSTHVNDANRSIALKTLAPVFKRSYEFHSLQKEVLKEEGGLHTAFGLQCHDLRSFEDTAALIMQMDLVVCVDTAVAHLCGALGCQVVMLNPKNTDFRWSLEGERTPWYPSMRIIRQRQLGQWQSQIQELGNLIAQILP